MPSQPGNGLPMNLNLVPTSGLNPSGRRLEATRAALTAGLGDPALTPVQAALAVLDQELAAMSGWLAAQGDVGQGREAIRRFGDLIRVTPALRAYQADMTGQSASAAGVLAARAGTTAGDPEPQITGPCSGCGTSRAAACAGTWTAWPRPCCSTSG